MDVSMNYTYIHTYILYTTHASVHTLRSYYELNVCTDAQMYGCTDGGRMYGGRTLHMVCLHICMLDVEEGGSLVKIRTCAFKSVPRN